MADATPSAGSKKLLEALKERGGKAALAKKLEISPDVVGRWTTGERKPTPPHRAQIQDDFGIDWRAWDHKPGWEPPEVAPAPDAFPADGVPGGS